jgi:hypothetical protein
MRRKFLLVFFLVTISTFTYSQFYTGGLSGSYTFPRTKHSTDSAGNIRFVPKDMGVSLQAGAFAGTRFQRDPWFGTYLSPSFAYNLSGRFRLKAGITISYGSGYGLPNVNDNFYSHTNGSATTTSIFVQGDYLLSNKLMVSGAVCKYFSPLNSPVSNTGIKNPEGERFLFNINYRPSKYFEINTTFDYGKGTGYSPYDPFCQPMFFSH